jgi:peptidoglycan/LPS O-acetylase OafA/YrhL
MDSDMLSRATSEKQRFYRADVDGMRAVAVLAVVGYHYWGQYIPGGFIGVDIFFVISGYLLSAIIVSDVQGRRFTFSGFYERRIRRIFPALFFFLGVATAGACLLLFPRDLLSYGRSMIAASLSSSNFYFWATTGYFDGAAGEKPLLHTWSLAVEEQFYIFFPIFIVLVHRYVPRYLRAVVTALTVASLAWSIVDVRIDQSAAFYLPFTRAWELLFGAMLTLRVIPVPHSKMLRESLAASGCLGIAASILLLSASGPFPGEYSLLPCASAGAIIAAGQDEATLTGRMLSWKPVAFIGLISYSLYLWHWPLLVFFTRLAPLPMKIRGEHTILAILSVVIAAISWRFVETPFRTGPRRPGKRTIYVFGAGCVAAFTLCALLLSVARGLPGRFPAEADSVASYLNYKESFPSEFEKLFRPGCFLETRERIADYDERSCLGPVEGKRQVLLFGDSHAADLQYGLESSIPNVHFLQATSAACRPTLGGGRFPECRRFVAKVLNEYISNRSISLVALNADWGSEDLPELTKTIEFIHRKGIGVVVFGPRPQYEVSLPRLLAKSVVNGNAGFPSRYRTDKQPLDAAMSRLAKETWRVPYISLMTILCPTSVCTEYAAPGVPLQFDNGHFTFEGSVYVGREVNARFPGIFESEPEMHGWSQSMSATRYDRN